MTPFTFTCTSKAEVWLYNKKLGFWGWSFIFDVQLKMKDCDELIIFDGTDLAKQISDITDLLDHSTVFSKDDYQTLKEHSDRYVCVEVASPQITNLTIAQIAYMLVSEWLKQLLDDGTYDLEVSSSMWGLKYTINSTPEVLSMTDGEHQTLEFTISDNTFTS